MKYIILILITILVLNDNRKSVKHNYAIFLSLYIINKLYKQILDSKTFIYLSKYAYEMKTVIIGW